MNNGWRSPEGLYTTQLVNDQNRNLLNTPGWHLLVDPNPFNPSQMDSLLFTDLSVKEREAMILQHARPCQADVEPLAASLLGELRGRFLNPAWLKPLMGHGYAGARTMGQEFIENLWGWQVTRPDLVKNWAWDEVKSVYFDDAHKLGLPEFLGRRHNAHVNLNL